VSVIQVLRASHSQDVVYADNAAGSEAGTPPAAKGAFALHSQQANARLYRRRKSSDHEKFMQLRRTHPSVLCALVGLVAACDASPSEPMLPAALELASGDAQVAVAGTAVPVSPAVVVRDQRGNPLPGITVSFIVSVGAGSVARSTAKSDMRGLASPGAWTLGARVGNNELTASAAALPAISFRATGTAGAPARILIHSGDAQSGVVASRVSIAPAVRVVDARDNPVAGVVVRFAAGATSGSVTGAERTTDAEGVAAVEGWTLGSATGAQTLDAVAGALASVTFRATALPAEPAALDLVSGDQQTGTVGSALQTPLVVRVRDAHGNPTSGASVRFDVIAGGGLVVGAVQAASSGAESTATLTDADGVARVAQWVLGTVAGTNTVRASVNGVAQTLSFNATGRAGPAAALSVSDGDQQSAMIGTAVSVRPSIRVRDQYDNAVAGVQVHFSVASGSGSITGEDGVTDAAGQAAVGSWTLGATPGTNTLIATVDGLTSATITATATQTVDGGGGGGGGGSGGSDPGSYGIVVRYTSAVSAAERAAIDGAAARWSSAIAGDLPAVQMSAAAGACGVPHPQVNELIDDLLVFVHITPMDGPGKVLGSAGPCYIRSGGGMPVMGAVMLDAADVANMVVNGSLGDVILHELGHVLGIGTLWGVAVSGEGGADPYFTGIGARAAFRDAGGSGYTGNVVPVENTGSGGTRDAHWRESVMSGELMTGWISGGGNPLSTITIAALGDLGYSVNTGAADPYFVGGSAPNSTLSIQRSRIDEAAWRVVPIAVDSLGRRRN
jgi:hypothetical protein